MGIPQGLTDITVHLQSPEERESQRAAADRHDWAEVDRFRPYLALHFGGEEVRFSTSDRSIHRAAKQVASIQNDIKAGRRHIPAPVINDRPTAWVKLDSLPEDD